MVFLFPPSGSGSSVFFDLPGMMAIKKLTFLTIFTQERSLLRVAHYHARVYSPSLVWTPFRSLRILSLFFSFAGFAILPKKSCAIYLYRNNSRVGVRWEQRTEWNIYSKFGRQTVPYLLHRLSQLFPFLRASIWKNTQISAIRTQRDFKFGIKFAIYHAHLVFI